MGAFTDRSGLLGPVTVRRCRNCGLGVSWPPIPDVAFLYSDRSSQDFQGDTRGIALWIKQFVFERQAKRLISLTPPPRRRWIDYGCGSGLFTRVLHDAGAGAPEVIGMDFHPEPPRDLGPTPYRSFSDGDDLAGSADVVSAMHVLEHDDDPGRVLSALSSLARSGGTLVLEVPNIDCVWAGVFGRFWDAWYLPYHRVHFSRAALRALVESQGMTVLREDGVCIPTFGRTAANLLGRRNSLPFILAGALLHPIQWLGEALTSRPSGLRLIVRTP
jgi:SAM-dependent methyltransferase